MSMPTSYKRNRMKGGTTEDHENFMDCWGEIIDRIDELTVRYDQRIIIMALWFESQARKFDREARPKKEIHLNSKKLTYELSEEFCGDYQRAWAWFDKECE